MAINGVKRYFSTKQNHPLVADGSEESLISSFALRLSSSLQELFALLPFSFLLP
jgi:hypothetical protein